MRWTIAQVAGAVGSRPGAGLDPVARVAGVSIDSRTVGAGELFIAIHGPRHDGHDHVASALESGAVARSGRRGAAGPICRRSTRAVHPRGRHLQGAQADLPRRYARAGAGRLPGSRAASARPQPKRSWRRCLGSRLRILKSEGNFNNEYGLPLTLFKLDETHQAAVLEMGMSRRGELSRLAEIARPDVGVVTRVAPAHLEFFASVEEIALAKRELIEGLNGPESVAVLNADDPLVAAFASHAPGRVLTYGIESRRIFARRRSRIAGHWARVSCWWRPGLDGWPEKRVRIGVVARGTACDCERVGGAGGGRASGKSARMRRGRCCAGCARRRCAGNCCGFRMERR